MNYKSTCYKSLKRLQSAITSMNKRWNTSHIYIWPHSTNMNYETNKSDYKVTECHNLQILFCNTAQICGNLQTCLRKTQWSAKYVNVRDWEFEVHQSWVWVNSKSKSTWCSEVNKFQIRHYLLTWGSTEGVCFSGIWPLQRGQSRVP